MKQVTLPSGIYIFVEVPNDVTDYKIGPTNYICFKINEEWSAQPPRLFGDFEIIFTTKEISEEQAESVVSGGSYMRTFWNYITNDTHKSNQLKTAKESLQSLIQANGLDLNKNYLILKKIMKNYLIETLQHDLEFLNTCKENDIIEFEMPSFCSGDYEAKIYKDDLGLYINSEDNFFKGCRDYYLKK